MAYPSIERPRVKKDFERPLPSQGRSKADPWWADAYDRGTLTEEQKKLIMAGKSDLAKKIQTEADKNYKDAARYETLGKAVDTADTAVTAASLLTGVGAIPKIGSKILAKKSSKEPMSKRKIGNFVSDIIKKVKDKKNKPKPKRETSSKTDPKKTGDVKDLTTEKVPSRPKRRTTSTEADPKIDMKSLDKSQKEAGLLPKTKGDRAKRVVSKIPKLAPTIPELAGYAKAGLSAATRGLYRGLSSPLGRGIIKRSPLPIALGVGGYKYLQNKKEKEAEGSGEGVSKNLGGFGRKGPTIEELLKGASPEQRAAYYKGKAGEASGTATSTEESASKEAINDLLRDQIFGPTTDDRPTSSFFTSGDEPKATPTPTPTTRSRPSPDSPLSYLRTDDEVEARNLSVRERMGKEQRGRRLDAEARFRERKDFMEQSKKGIPSNIIQGKELQGPTQDGKALTENFGRVLKDSTGRIVGYSLNKAGRSAMGNRKGAGVIDGSMRDTALGLDKRDAQIASMRAAQKDVADMFYSRSGASGGSGGSGATPAPRAIPVDKGYVEGQGGYGLPAPNTTDVPDAPRAIPVNTPAPRAIPVAPRATAVKPSTPSDVALGNQLGSMDMNPPNNPSISPPSKSNNPPNIPVDRIGSVVPANVTADSYNWAEVEKNMPAGSTDTPPTTMSLKEYPFDEKGNYDEAAAGNKKPTVATVVTNLLKKKKK